MQPWQLTIATDTRHALFPSEARRLASIFTLVRVFQEILVMFCIVDDHVHLVVLSSRERLGHISRMFKLCMAAQAAAPTAPVRTKAIEGRRHMESVHRYVLRQPSHHGLPGHQALWSGSCFPDLVGARWIPGAALRIHDVLPRIRPADACRCVGLDPKEVIAFTLEEVRAAGAASLVSAAAAACGAPQEMTGGRATTSRARRCACTIARRAGIPTGEMAWALNVHPGSVRKCVSVSIPEPALEATLMRLGLERAVVHAIERERKRFEASTAGRHPGSPHR